MYSKELDDHEGEKLERTWLYNVCFLEYSSQLAGFYLYLKYRDRNPLAESF